MTDWTVVALANDYHDAVAAWLPPAAPEQEAEMSSATTTPSNTED